MQQMHLCSRLLSVNLNFKMYRATVFPVVLKVWRGSNIWELHRQIKIAFMTKLLADVPQGMLATIWPRLFCLPVCCPKI
jgi:hypothetical protein